VWPSHRKCTRAPQRSLEKRTLCRVRRTVSRDIGTLQVGTGYDGGGDPCRVRGSFSCAPAVVSRATCFPPRAARLRPSRRHGSPAVFISTCSAARPAPPTSTPSRPSFKERPPPPAAPPPPTS